MSDALEAVESAVLAWAYRLGLLRRPLTAIMLTDAWIAGLREAGFKAERPKVWGRGKYPTTLPLVIEFPCPYMHRTPDRRDFAKVRLIVEDDGWVSLDPESPCEQCTAQVLERWLLTCPRCEAGEDSDFHPGPDWHGLDHQRWQTPGPDERLVFNPDGPIFDGSTSPLSFVLWQFRMLCRIADAKWWVEHTDEAIAEAEERWPTWLVEPHRAARIAKVLADSRGVLARAPAPPPRSSPAAPKETWTDEKVLAWLEQHEIPRTLTSRGAWERAKAIPGRPPKNAIESARRATK